MGTCDVYPGVKRQGLEADHLCQSSVEFKNAEAVPPTTKHRLLVFESKILRKIFGPSRNHDGSWRIKTNDELDNLIKGRNTVNFIRVQRISWLGHISRMEAERTV
jgi:hypothetical protein